VLASLSMPWLLSLMDSILVSQTSRTQLPPWYAHKVTYAILIMQLLLQFLFAVFSFISAVIY
jgi:hypothetical protein